MYNFSQENISQITYSLILPMVRIISTISNSPILGESFVDRKIKIIISFLITLILLPTINQIEPLPSYDIKIIDILEQFLIGISLGFSFKIIFVIAIIAGELISLQMGLSFSIFFDFNSHSNISVISRLLNNLMLLVFLSLNSYLWIIASIVDSFHYLPISQHINKTIFFILIHYLGTLFLKGIILSLPIIIVILVVNIMMALLMRMTPQLSIFSLLLPITLLISMFFLYKLLTINTIFFKNLFTDYFNSITHNLYSKL
ncbi:flagellar biosynthetic protein [Buchnera aphidicola (Nipponaphis monzeni)]|uniref:Flagellar biosynthetic protein FliR n=1 Tax=Buchnera aphidicola (Nipponaphis monzeni) TaxID=2495405 RepID=A0A455T9V9_9GAMM|nr:flagellar biosynthetic protein FliR [Buchnera aphidicola]BBI01085.1 flagellar biosynthetic protein [Buchnera aphidicola (Nipponaphis monzeni)]